MIELRNVTKSYLTPAGRHTVFENLSFAFASGRNVALLGRNGAGKSTLIRLLGGVDSPDSGRVVTNGKKISWPVNFGSGIQPTLSARDAVKFACRIFGLGGELREQKLAFVKEFAELGDSFERPVKGYSSGMRSRLAFGLTMAFDFDYYLIDEVMAVGDAEFKERSRTVLREKMQGANIVLVSHNMKLVRELCDQVVVVKDGSLVSFDEMEEGIQAYQGDAYKKPKTLSRRASTDDVPEEPAANIRNPTAAVLKRVRRRHSLQARQGTERGTAPLGDEISDVVIADDSAVGEGVRRGAELRRRTQRSRRTGSVAGLTEQTAAAEAREERPSKKRRDRLADAAADRSLKASKRVRKTRAERAVSEVGRARKAAVPPPGSPDTQERPLRQSRVPADPSSSGISLEALAVDDDGSNKTYPDVARKRRKAYSERMTARAARSVEPSASPKAAAQRAPADVAAGELRRAKRRLLDEQAVLRDGDPVAAKPDEASTVDKGSAARRARRSKSAADVAASSGSRVGNKTASRKRRGESPSSPSVPAGANSNPQPGQQRIRVLRRARLADRRAAKTPVPAMTGPGGTPEISSDHEISARRRRQRVDKSGETGGESTPSSADMKPLDQVAPKTVAGGGAAKRTGSKRRRSDPETAQAMAAVDAAHTTVSDDVATAPPTTSSPI